MVEITNIVVTSAGTASAISVIKALKLQNEISVNIIAVDTDKLAAGLYLADHFEIVPPANSADYIDNLISVCNKYNASILLPIYSKEISKIASNKEYLKNNGIITFLSTPDVIELCNNKKEMNEVVESLGIKVAKIFSPDELKSGQIRFPIFCKPNSGSSSTGAEKIEDKLKLESLIASGKNLIFQELIQGEEVTVDILCDEQSNPIVISPRLRLSTKSGQSVKGKTIPNEEFKGIVNSICTKLGIKGVCNIQFFLTPDGPVFLEVNPRFAAGGLMLTIKAGANIPLILLKLILNKSIEKKDTIAGSNFVMTRYWEEIIFEEK